MQELKLIRVFLEVAEQRSFVAAARNLNMTPASATRLIARLEEYLGQQLLVRTTRQVSLTSSGAVVAARYRPLIEDFDRVTDEITRESCSDRGRLAINAPMSFGLQLMPRLIESFRLAYPNITLDVKLTDTLVDIVEEACDLAIRISDPPQDKSTIWRKICEVPRHVIAAPHLFDRIPRPKTPDELDRNYCLSYAQDGGPENWRFRKGPVMRNFRAGVSVVSNNGDFLYALAVGGNGIVVLPSFIACGGIATGEVERLLTDWDLPSLWLSLFYPPYADLPPLVATFTEFFEVFIQDVDVFDISKER